MDKQENQVTPSKKIRLKIVIRRDAAMSALRKLGEEENYAPYEKPQISICNAETGEEIEGYNDIQINFNPYEPFPRVVLTLLDPTIEIHYDTQNVSASSTALSGFRFPSGPKYSPPVNPSFKSPMVMSSENAKAIKEFMKKNETNAHTTK